MNKKDKLSGGSSLLAVAQAWIANDLTSGSQITVRSETGNHHELTFTKELLVNELNKLKIALLEYEEAKRNAH
jgi:hypothetical protein